MVHSNPWDPCTGGWRPAFSPALTSLWDQTVLASIVTPRLSVCFLSHHSHITHACSVSLPLSPTCPSIVRPTTLDAGVWHCQVMPQLLSFMALDLEDPQAPDWCAAAPCWGPRAAAAAGVGSPPRPTPDAGVRAPATASLPRRGTIAVYSCPASCAPPPAQGPDGHSAYVEEVAWVQPT